LGELVGINDCDNYVNKRFDFSFAAVNKGIFSPFQSSNKRKRRFKLLFGMENIDKLRPQKYSSVFAYFGHGKPNNLQ
jgi:uncharacterized short protein YbdD (DUF466 family)